MNVNGPSRPQVKEHPQNEEDGKLEQIRRTFSRKFSVSKSAPIPTGRSRASTSNEETPSSRSSNLGGSNPAVSPPRGSTQLKKRYSSFSEKASAANSAEPSPTLQRAKSLVSGIFTPKTSRPPSPTGLCKESGLSPILERDEQFVGAIEILQNSAANFRFLDLAVPQDMSTREFSDRLLRDLTQFKEAIDNKHPLPKVLGKEVPEIDIKAFWNFAGQILVNEEWTNLFHEMILRLDEKKQKNIYISPRVREGLARMQTREDAELLAKHLMSECTKIRNQVRVIRLEALQLLMMDIRIKAFPGMIDLVKEAADQVMEDAIRECQSSILFSALRAANSDVRLSLQRWEEKVKTCRGQHLDLNGIHHIAKMCKISVEIFPDPEDQQQNNLKETLALNDKIFKVMEMYGEL